MGDINPGRRLRHNSFWLWPRHQVRFYKDDTRTAPSRQALWLSRPSHHSPPLFFSSKHCAFEFKDLDLKFMYYVRVWAFSLLFFMAQERKINLKVANLLCSYPLGRCPQVCLLLRLCLLYLLPLLSRKCIQICFESLKQCHSLLVKLFVLKHKNIYYILFFLVLQLWKKRSLSRNA